MHVWPGWFDKDGDEIPENDVALIVFDPPIHRLATRPLRVASPGDVPASPVAARIFGVYRHPAGACGGTGGDFEGGLQYIPRQGFGSPDRWSFLDAVADPPGDSGTCQGDSGSPITVGLVPSAERVFSVVSYFVGDTLYGPNLAGVMYPSFLWPLGIDRDGDGIPADRDNCDWSPNGGQEDRDGDGVGDACDLCWGPDNELEANDDDGLPDCLDPCDFAFGSPTPLHDDDDCGTGLGRAYGDAECDGVCDDVDTCTATPNVELKNANQLLESNFGAAAWPDACDPVLVPDLEIDERRIGGGGTDTFAIEDVVTVYAQDLVSVTARKSRRAPNVSTGFLTRAYEDVDTHFRYCQSTPQRDCKDEDNTLYERLRLEIAGPAEESQEDPYHRVTLSHTPVRGGRAFLDYDDGEHLLVWNYLADAEYYFLRDFIDDTGPETATTQFGQTFSTSRAGALRGVFWAHADSLAGHPGGSDFERQLGVHEFEDDGTPQLAGEFHEVDPEYLTHHTRGRGLQEDLPFFIWRTLPDPQPWENVLTERSRPDDAILFGAVNEHFWGIVELDGHVREATDVLGDGVRESLVDRTQVWANAVETWAAIGADQPQMIAIDPVAGVLSDALGYGRGGGSLLGGKAPTATLAAAAAAAATATDDAAAFDPLNSAVVYSRFFTRAYVLAGSPRGAAPSGRLLTMQVDDDGVLLEKHLDLPLGHVLAATASYADGNLWVLDEVPDGPRPARMRLLRFAALGGTGGVVASWKRRDLNDRFWLGLDSDGSILAQASRSRGAGHHVVVRVSLGEAPTVQRLLEGPGALAFPVVVDPNGYTVWRKRQGRLEGERRPDLDGPTGSIGWLGSLL